jgi:hypothetical protein
MVLIHVGGNGIAYILDRILVIPERCQEWLADLGPDPAMLAAGLGSGIEPGDVVQKTGGLDPL